MIVDSSHDAPDWALEAHLRLHAAQHLDEADAEGNEGGDLGGGPRRRCSEMNVRVARRGEA